MDILFRFGRLGCLPRNFVQEALEWFQGLCVKRVADTCPFNLAGDDSGGFKDAQSSGVSKRLGKHRKGFVFRRCRKWCVGFLCVDVF